VSDGRQKRRAEHGGRRDSGASAAFSESWLEIAGRAEAAAEKLANERSTAATQEAQSILREIALALRQTTEEGIASGETEDGATAEDAEA
jgi:hypothetical protein